MKSMLLKDLYNLRSSVRYLAVMMLVFAVAFIPMGYLNYLTMGAVVFSIMMVNTFSYDDLAKWNRFALVMPIRRQDVVAGKFLISLLFSAVGTGIGCLGSVVGGALLGQLQLSDAQAWKEILSVMEIAFCVALLFGVTMIPLLFRFGVERARLISAGAVALPILAFFAFYKIPGLKELLLTQTGIRLMLLFCPVFTLLWAIAMYQVSCLIFLKKEF